MGPGDKNTPDVVRERIELGTMPALGGLYAKAAGRTIASGATLGIRRAVNGLPLPLPFARGGSGRRRAGLSLPAVELHVPAVTVDAAGHRAFCEVVGARPRSRPGGETEAFSGYLHALAFPAAMSLLTRDDFPLPTVGLVHLANSVEQTAPVAVGEVLEVTVWAEELRAHRVGAMVDVVVELRRATNDDGAPGAGAAHAEPAPVWVGRSVYLARGVRLGDTQKPGDRGQSDSGQGAAASEADSGADGQKNERSDFVPPTPTARWQLGADTGRKYAAVSGDVNPIHLSGPSAKALGMKGAIAHGMYTASRALAMLDAPAPLRWEVEFASPLVLPAAPAVAVQRDGRGTDLREATVTVWNAKKRKPHATLEVRR